MGPLLDVLNQTLAAQYLLPMRDGAQLAQRLATHPARVFAYDGMERSISRNTDHAKQEEGYSTKRVVSEFWGMVHAEFFEEVTDYRVQGRYLHELSDILLLVLYELLGDCETFEDIYDYACDEEAMLREFMDLPAGISSHDTLNRVSRHLAPAELERCLSQWRHAIVTLLAGRYLIIDGK